MAYAGDLKSEQATLQPRAPKRSTANNTNVHAEFQRLLRARSRSLTHRIAERTDTTTDTGAGTSLLGFQAREGKLAQSQMVVLGASNARRRAFCVVTHPPRTRT